MLAEHEPMDNWCGFHLDHSLLTGLCSVSPHDADIDVRRAQWFIGDVSS
jgi:hypothetical protein